MNKENEKQSQPIRKWVETTKLEANKLWPSALYCVVNGREIWLIPDDSPPPIASAYKDDWKEKFKEKFPLMRIGGDVNITDIVVDYIERYIVKAGYAAAQPLPIDKGSEGDRGCPCKYLEEPCHRMCTCVNGASSFGCMYCATYGSLEQRKKAAERIASKLRTTDTDKEAVEGWMKEKPKADREFSFVSASWWRDHWEYKVWSVTKVDSPEGWYYGLCDDEGDEWADYDDLTADLFLILPAPPQQ